CRHFCACFLAETSSYKTPKRRLARRSRLPTFSSPVNETEMQQEIFWDPQSPIAHQLGSEQRKQAVSGCTVDISEIVNRIAPQDEKPECCEGSLLGLWIGDNAIPCTPGITKARSRIKVKNREEELMKLAKEFDKNLTDATQDQDALCHNIACVTSTETQEEARGENQEQLPREHPSVGAAVCLDVAKKMGSTEHCESSSQKSIETALNDLFDGPTQKCSGALSQGSLNCSSDSSFLEKQNTLLKEKHTLDNARAATGGAETTSEEVVPRDATSQKEPVDSTELDRVTCDDFEDWDVDLLPDDSFLLQITQDPEQSILARALPRSANEGSKITKRIADPERFCLAQCATSNNHDKVPASCALWKQSMEIGKNKPALLHKDFPLKPSAMDSVSKSSPNRASGCHSVSMTFENGCVQGSFTQLKCVASTNSPGKRAASPSVARLPKQHSGKYQSNMHRANQLATISATAKPQSLKKAVSRNSTGPLKQTDVPPKSVLLFDDWNKSRFSEKVPDLFCEPTSPWGPDYDDDDLLYQVCDDIEKNTLSQDVKENEEAKLVVRKTKSEVGTSVQGVSNCLLAQRSHVGRKTFSLDATLKIATLGKPCSPADNSVQHSGALLKPESVSSIPRKWHRFHSVPEGGFVSSGSSATLSDVCANNNTLQPGGLYNMGKVENTGDTNHVPSAKTNCVFRNTSNSQNLVLDCKNVKTATLSRTKVGLCESRNAPNIPVQSTLQVNLKPTLKRHLSDSFAQSQTGRLAVTGKCMMLWGFSIMPECLSVLA
uniref:ETAA1 activator of ATR kinase n=1 Tax=Varanus komodoensis TaxID=61221 RepID=A0A8D2LN78_VARKO